MKTTRMNLLIVFAIFITLLTSCEKEESILTGRLTYKGAISGIVYTAPNTPIYLYLGSPQGEPYKSVITDADGFFQFQGLWSAHWYIASTITVNGFNYSGVIGTTMIDGKNVVTLNLMME